MSPREKSRERIRILTESLVEKQKQEISTKNELIDEENKIAKKNHKTKYQHQINPVAFIPKKHIKSYSTSQFTRDISEKYNLNFDYVKYNQYISGVAYPSLELLHALSKEFGVSLDYICGYDDIPNPAIATIATLLPLNQESIASLRDLSSNPTFKAMLDSLFRTPETTANVLQNIRNQLQQRYEQNVRIQNNESSTKQQLLLSTMYYEELLSQLEHILLPILKAEFDQKLMLDDAFINRDITSYATAFHNTKQQDSQ